MFQKVVILDEHEQRIWDYALTILGSDQLVQDFILTYFQELNNLRPIDVMQTKAGRDQVVALIHNQRNIICN